MLDMLDNQTILMSISTVRTIIKAKRMVMAMIIMVAAVESQFFRNGSQNARVLAYTLLTIVN